VAYELVIRLGRFFDVLLDEGKTQHGGFTTVRQLRVQFLSKEDADAAQSEVDVFVRQVRDYDGGAPVVAGEVIHDDAGDQQQRDTDVRPVQAQVVRNVLPRGGAGE
jgi:hypothetical protein